MPVPVYMTPGWPMNHESMGQCHRLALGMSSMPQEAAGGLLFLMLIVSTVACGVAIRQTSRSKCKGLCTIVTVKKRVLVTAHPKGLASSSPSGKTVTETNIGTEAETQSMLHGFNVQTAKHEDDFTDALPSVDRYSGSSFEAPPPAYETETFDLFTTPHTPQNDNDADETACLATSPDSISPESIAFFNTFLAMLVHITALVLEGLLIQNLLHCSDHPTDIVFRIAAWTVLFTPNVIAAAVTIGRCLETLANLYPKDRRPQWACRHMPLVLLFLPAGVICVLRAFVAAPLHHGVLNIVESCRRRLHKGAENAEDADFS